MKSGSQINKILPHDHLLLLYQKNNEWQGIISEFLISGIERGEKCIYIGNKESTGKMKSNLYKEGFDIKDLEERGALNFVSSKDFYTRFNEFHPDYMIKYFKELITSMLKEGYKGLRVTGDLSCLLNEKVTEDVILKYEEKMGKEIISRYPVMAICRYSMNKFSSPLLKKVFTGHPYVIWKGKIHQNPYYTPYGIKGGEEVELKRWLNNLEVFSGIKSRFKNEYEEKINRQQQQLREIIDLVPHLIFAKDKQGRFILVNKAVADIYGLKPDEIEGKTHLELHKNINPSELEVFISSDKKAIEEGKTIVIPQEKITDINGNEHIFRTKKIPFHTLENNKEAVLGTAVDITELVETREELEASYNQLEAFSKELEKYSEIQSNIQREIIIAMTKMLEIHDAYTKGHSRSVAQIAKKIAESMGLSEEDVDKTYWTGMVHDIGKTLVPAKILNKKGSLTEKEFAVVKKHPVWGYETLKEAELLKDISRYVLHHHERWDGGGYPDHLAKEEIPLISRIITVADAWDAMRSDRAYRNALPFEVALGEVDKNKEKQFDPLAAEALLDVVGL